MITSVKEIHVGKVPHGSDGLLFWTYMICRVRSDGRARYDLIRINNDVEKMERLGCELSLGHCRQLIQEWEAKDVFSEWNS